MSMVRWMLPCLLLSVSAWAENLDVQGMRVLLPNGWKKSAEGAQSAEGVENIGITGEDSAGMTLDEFASASVEALAKQLAKFARVSTEDVKLGGAVARAVTYTCEVQGVPVTMRTNFVISRNRAYALTYATTTERFAARQTELKLLESSVKFP